MERGGPTLVRPRSDLSAPRHDPLHSSGLPRCRALSEHIYITHCNLIVSLRQAVRRVPPSPPHGRQAPLAVRSTCPPRAQQRVVEAARRRSPKRLRVVPNPAGMAVLVLDDDGGCKRAARRRRRGRGRRRRPRSPSAGCRPRSCGRKQAVRAFVQVGNDPGRRQARVGCGEATKPFRRSRAGAEQPPRPPTPPLLAQHLEWRHASPPPCPRPPRPHRLLACDRERRAGQRGARHGGGKTQPRRGGGHEKPLEREASARNTRRRRGSTRRAALQRREREAHRGW